MTRQVIRVRVRSENGAYIGLERDVLTKDAITSELNSLAASLVGLQMLHDQVRQMISMGEMIVVTIQLTLDENSFDNSANTIQNYIDSLLELENNISKKIPDLKSNIEKLRKEINSFVDL